MAAAPYETLARIEPHHLIEQFPIRHPTENRTWFYGRLYRTARPGGRRLLVLNLLGLVEYDTGDQFDEANALARLDSWLTEQVRQLDAELSLLN